MAQPMVYKGRPVVRDGNKLYFGEPQNPFMVVLTVLQNVNDVPSRILVQLQNTDPALAFSNMEIASILPQSSLLSLPL